MIISTANLGSRGMLGIFKSTPDQPDSEITVRHMLDPHRDSRVTQLRVLDRLVQIVDEIGVFGGLLAAKKDWDDPAIHKRSYQLLADSVMPRLRQHVAARKGMGAAA